MSIYLDHSGDWLTHPADVEKLMTEARRLRARAMTRYLSLAGHALTALAGRLLRPFAQWRERAALAAELNAMTDRQLADIGLSRCDVGAVVSGCYRSERGRGIRRRPLLVRLDPGVRRIAVERITEISRAA